MKTSEKIQILGELNLEELFRNPEIEYIKCAIPKWPADSLERIQFDDVVISREEFESRAN